MASTPSSWWKYACWATSPAVRAASWPLRRTRSHSPQRRVAASIGAAARASVATAVAWPARCAARSTESSTSASGSTVAGVTPASDSHQV